MRHEIDHRPAPERAHASPAAGARDTKTVFEDLGHVVAEAGSKGRRKGAEQQAVHGTHARPRAQFLALASRTTSASRAVSAAATRRPRAVIR